MSASLTGPAVVGLALLAAAALVLLPAALRWRQALQRLVARAQALHAGHLEPAAAPGDAAMPPPPGLRALSRALDGIALRLRTAFEAHAHEVARLQALAQADAVTALPRREVFRAALDERLAAPLPSTLLLLRIGPLATLNERIGHAATDALLAGAAEVLRTYVGRVPGSLAGRLNGSDFALWLPVGGVGAETGASLLQALAASPLAREAGAVVAVGAVEGASADVAGPLPEAAAARLLAAADAALAQAEAVLAGEAPLAPAPAASPPLPPRTALAVQAPGEGAAARAGARAWREQLAQALAERRVRLDAVPVHDAAGAVWHLAATLRVQIEPAGPWLAPRQWLALAARSRLLAEFDLLALELALAAIAADGQPRAVRIGAAVLGSVQGRSALLAQIADAPEAAWALVLELAEAVLPLLDAAAAPDAGEAAACLARCQAAGVRLGAEHTGRAPGALVQWSAAGVRHLVMPGAALRGVAASDELGAWAGGVCALARGLGLQLLAEGVDERADQEALRGLGFDGVSARALEPA